MVKRITLAPELRSQNTLVTTQSGIGRTVAVYQSPEAPIELMISDLPFNDSVRDFQRLSRFSSLVTRSIQLACSTLEVPK